MKQIEARKLKYIEYKSYLDASGISLDQFRNYLHNITDLSELKYIFSADKLSLDEAKKGMQAVMRNNAEVIWNTNPSLFKKMNKLNSTKKLNDWEDLFDLLDDKNLSYDHAIFDFIETIK
ncbi:hypothetical protein [Saccharicrinis aurantiacus]|uniref:hypothetical protein n=1 Tax=Saccharicrinis aurantiacus TaxID=1849719 RepID=UPI00094F7435|nr:hypothetical protein [Saccharicrinis aurantiacus]